MTFTSNLTFEQNFKFSTYHEPRGIACNSDGPEI